MSRFFRDVSIRFAHCDPAGLIFYPRFFALVNESVEDWFASLGHSFKTLHMDRRKGVPTVRLESEFIAPVRIGDTLRQSLSVDAIGRSSCSLKHLAEVDGRPVARFDQTIVFTDLAAMKAEPWPADMRSSLARFAGFEP
jgi:4-hydroxybenzoyl-CoA thioesterase